MNRDIKKRITAAMEKIREELRAGYDPSNPYSVLKWEGYDGGYLDALEDVMLVMNGVEPNNRGRYWWR